MRSPAGSRITRIQRAGLSTKRSRREQHWGLDGHGSGGSRANILAQSKQVGPRNDKGRPHAVSDSARGAYGDQKWGGDLDNYRSLVDRKLHNESRIVQARTSARINRRYPSLTTTRWVFFVTFWNSWRNTSTPTWIPRLVRYFTLIDRPFSKGWRTIYLRNPRSGSVQRPFRKACPGSVRACCGARCQLCVYRPRNAACD
jgi:hypothetical protein